MRNLLQVAAREVRDRRAVFVAAAVAALIPLAVGYVPWSNRHDAADARNAVALVLGAALSVGLALTIGAATVARELRERRLGFYFARPLTASAIWWGKLLAGYLVAASALVIVLAPAVILDRLGGKPQNWALARTSFLATLGILTLLAVGHALAVVVGSRSPFIVVDVAALGVVGLLVWSGSRTLARAMATDAMQMALRAFSLSVVVALLAAGLAQVSIGRTDGRRGHRVLSLVLWGVLAVAAVAVDSYARWVVNATPGDLAGLDVPILAPRGHWIVVSGRARGRGDYYPSFLYDTASGRSVRLGAGFSPPVAAALSADGSSAAWVVHEGDGTGGVAEVMTFDLRSRDSSPRTTTVMFARDAYVQLSLSDDGVVLATMSGSMLSVSNLASGKLLASVRVPERFVYRMFFVPSGDRLRLVGAPWTQGSGSGPVDVRLFELDLATRRLEETGRIAELRLYSWVTIKRDSTGGRLLMVRRDASGASVTLADARTGITLATLATIAGAGPTRAAFLADDRIVVAEPGARGARLRTFAPDGMPARTVDLGSAAAVAIGGEAARGQVAVSLSKRLMGSRNDRRTMLVDVDNGSVRPLEAGFAPVAVWRWWDIPRALSPGSVGARLFYGPAKSLVLFDPSTGTFGTLLGGDQPEQAGE